VKIAAPTAEQVIKKDKAADFAIKLDVKNWQTATGSSHVHLILDARPYKAIYDPKQPVKISELTGGEPLTEGQHVLVAFPSRTNHESVKTAGALAVTEFWVEKKGAKTVDIKKPMLVYSRPKGDYNGEMANHVIVDFQLVNTKLGEGKEAVQITAKGPGIDGELSSKVSKFGPPLFLDNLQNGTYSVKAELLAADGKPVENGGWNATSRDIKVDRNAPTPAPMAMPSPAAGAASSAAGGPSAPAAGAPAGSAAPTKKK
jgi:hypothetical protein